MNRDFSHFKEDIIKSCVNIVEYVNGHTINSFVKDHKSYYAVLMNFSIIGESAGHFSEEIKNNNKEIDWKAIISMRNFIIHEYFEIDPMIVWQTAKEDIPKLLEKIRKIKL
jgi:uncharacterized protein with HEPN domain